MGVAKAEDFDDDYDELDGDEQFGFLEEGEQPAIRRNKLAWRSVEDYLDNKRLKQELSDIYDEDWY